MQTIDLLREAIIKQLYGTVIEEEIVLGVDEAKLRAQLYELGAVLSETLIDEGGWRLKIRMNASARQRALS